MDFSALALASSVLALLLSLVLGLTLRWVPDSDGARLWALAFLPFSAGQALKLVEAGTTMQAVLHDPLILGGFALLLTGLRQYLQLPHIWLLSGAIVLGSLVANALLTAVWPLPAGRHAVRLAGMAMLSLACLLTLRSLREPALRPVRIFLQGVFGLLVLLSLLRLALLVPLARGLAVLGPVDDLARLSLGVMLLAALLGLMLLLTARMNLRLGRLSMHDALTGVLNRRGLDEAAHTTLAFARRLGRPVGLLLCDLDHFKALNDRHGHARGDEALRAFAALLQQQFDGGDLIGRIGGEEFAVLLPGADADAAWRAAETLRERVAAHPLVLDGEAVPLSVSIGVLSQPAFDASWAGMLARADLALYEAKARGRNACVLAGRDGREPAAGRPRTTGVAPA